MIQLFKWLDGPWEEVRGYLREDLDHVEAALNQQAAQTFDQNDQLLSGAIAGDASQDTRYVSNTGVNHGPRWALVNLLNGVTNRLAFSHLAALSVSTLLGRGSVSGAGDPQEIAVGAGLVMSGATLTAASIPISEVPDKDIFTHTFMGCL